MSALRVRYQTIEFGTTDIHLRTLRDRQEFDDQDDAAADLGISSSTWSLFGIVWGSSELLARLMYDYDIEKLRILEVGCGIGLASMVLNHRCADITATDHNPAAQKFLEENVKLNKAKPIPFVCADWSGSNSTLGKFDLIIGSDLLYEPDSAALLARFINHHALPQCKVLLIDPGRGYQSKFSKKMITLGYSSSRTLPTASMHDALTLPTQNAPNFKILSFER